MLPFILLSSLVVLPFFLLSVATQQQHQQQQQQQHRKRRKHNLTEQQRHFIVECVSESLQRPREEWDHEAVVKGHKNFTLKKKAYGRTKEKFMEAFGQEISVKGIQKVWERAKEYRVSHAVFWSPSEHPGQPMKHNVDDLAEEIYKMLHRETDPVSLDMTDIYTELGKMMNPIIPGQTMRKYNRRCKAANNGLTLLNLYENQALEVQIVPVNVELDGLFERGQVRILKLNNTQQKIFQNIHHDAKVANQVTNKINGTTARYETYNVATGRSVEWRQREPWNNPNSRLVLNLLDGWGKALLPKDPEEKPTVCPAFLWSRFCELQRPHLDYKRLIGRGKRGTKKQQQAELDPDCMAHSLHVPLDTNGGWLHVWVNTDEFDNGGRMVLSKPILIHIPYGYACALRWDVIHAGHFVWDKENNKFLLEEVDGKDNFRFFAHVIPSDNFMYVEMDSVLCSYNFPEGSTNNISFPPISII